MAALPAAARRGFEALDHACAHLTARALVQRDRDGAEELDWLRASELLEAAARRIEIPARPRARRGYRGFGR